MAIKKKAKGNFTVSLSELSQEIDLKDYLGRKPTANEKKLFAELAIDTIASRTLDTTDVNGESFAKYSEEYAKKKGVSVDSVDLFLDGDMLGGIGRRSSKEKTGSVFIQMKKGLQTRKAYNHNTGDTLVQREFFAITDDEAVSIAEAVREEKEDKKKNANGTTLAQLRDAVNSLGIEQVE